MMILDPPWSLAPNNKDEGPGPPSVKAVKGWWGCC